MRNVDECAALRKRLNIPVERMADMIGIRDFMLEHYESLGIAPMAILGKYNKAIWKFRNEVFDTEQKYADYVQVLELKELRKSLRITQRELADVICLTNCTYSEKELGRLRMTMKEYNACVEYLNNIKNSRKSKSVK